MLSVEVRWPTPRRQVLTRLYFRIIGFLLFAVVLFLCVRTAGAQSTDKQNLNFYYHFPVSVGVEYQNLSPFSSYSSNFNSYEVNASLHWPLPRLPVLQPTLNLGAVQFDSTSTTDPLTWNHTNWIAEIGVRYATRMSKQFEVGAEALAGYSMVTFPNLLPSSGTLAANALVAEAGGVLSLDPSFNMSISIHPNLKYVYYLNPLTDFNGLIFSIGFQADYRFGQDPDAPQAVIRSIRFDKVNVPSLFPAMQSYYVKHPIGTVTFTNTDKTPIKDLSISFNQKGYMDSPTQSAKTAELAPGASTTANLYASFNSQVFTTEGTTPLTGEVIVDYTSNGRPAEQKQSVSYDLYDKTAITWTDDRKVGAFITPADSALRNYASFIRQASKGAAIAGLNTTLQYAMQLYGALGELGILYQSDPTSPFTAAQSNAQIVDSVNVPRDTLKRTTGDCDDLTVLFDSMLETAGVTSGFITVPGHIYAAFDTHVPSRNYAQLNPDRSMTISVDGELWIPVEITLIGRAGFMEAWRKGIEEYAEWDKQPEKRKFYKTAAAQAIYRPVGLKETDLGLQYGSKAKIVADFKSEAGKLIDVIANQYVQAASKRKDKRDYNRLGVVYAKFEELTKAQNAFQRALSMDPNYLSPRLNLANLQFLEKNYSQAVTSYVGAVKTLEKNGLGDSQIAAKLFINISKTYYLLERFNEARTYFSRAESIDPKVTDSYAYLASGTASTNTGRAAEAVDSRMDIQYFDDTSGGQAP